AREPKQENQKRRTKIAALHSRNEEGRGSPPPFPIHHRSAHGFRPAPGTTGLVTFTGFDASIVLKTGSLFSRTERRSAALTHRPAPGSGPAPGRTGLVPCPGFAASTV